MPRSSTKAWIVAAATLLLPTALAGQARSNGGTLGLEAALVREVAVNAEAAKQIAGNAALSQALVVRDGAVRARRGYALYRAGRKLAVRNDTGTTMERQTRFTWGSVADEAWEIALETCGCQDTDDDTCGWTRSGECAGDPRGCCDVERQRIGVAWGRYI